MPRRTTRKRANVFALKCAGALCAIVAVVAGLVSCSQQAASAKHDYEHPARADRDRSGVGRSLRVNLTFDRHGGLWFSSSGGKALTDRVWYTRTGGLRQGVNGLEPGGLRNDLYVASTNDGAGTITVLSGFNRNQLHKPEHEAERHYGGANNVIGSIALGPDGQLYIGVGAPSENSGPSGSVLSFAPDRGSSVVKATGVRSAFGLAFHGRPARDRHQSRRS